MLKCAKGLTVLSIKSNWQTVFLISFHFCIYTHTHTGLVWIHTRFEGKHLCTVLFKFFLKT